MQGSLDASYLEDLKGWTYILKKQTVAQKLMSEYINLGGEIMTRQEAVNMLRADGCSEQCIDITVFSSHVEVVTPEIVQTYQVKE